MVVSSEIMWRGLGDNRCFEHARLQSGPNGAVLSGTVLAVEAGAPLRVDYTVDCDAAWRTRSAIVQQAFRGERSTRELTHDGTGRWLVDGRPAPALDGCTDLDLGVSPVTNTLPVNRLGLGGGATGEIRAAWVLFPGLEVVAARQSYQRLADDRYRFRGLDSGFEAEITVDGDGLVIDYEGLWERVAGLSTAAG